MKKALKIIIVIIIILTIKWVFTYSLNELIISNYHNEKYNSKLNNILYPLTLNSSYVVYYNHGNIYYQKKNYDESIKKYQKALTKNPPQKRVCDIRINLSLSMLAKININETDKILEQLKSARYVLYENNCVDPNYENSYSKEAEKLEKEIKELENQYENPNQNESNDNNQQNQEEDNNQDQDIEEQLQEKEKQAKESRQDELNHDESLGNYDYYRGKRW